MCVQIAVRSFFHLMQSSIRAQDGLVLTKLLVLDMLIQKKIQVLV